jgi:predicted ATP-dependent endonuclease of OLD family
MSQVASSGVLLKGDQRDSLAPYRAAVRSVCPRLALSHVEASARGATLWFEREGGTLVELGALSHSEEQAVLFAITFHLFGLNASIVLIDEPELHLHPDEHVRFLEAIRALGQDNQIIVATSSASLLAAAPARQVIHLGRAARREPS